MKNIIKYILIIIIGFVSGFQFRDLFLTPCPDTINVYKAEWVKVIKPIKNENNTFSQNDTCIIGRNENAKIQFMGKDIKLGDLLKYRTTGGAAGTACPDGTLFFTGSGQSSLTWSERKSENQIIENNISIVDALIKHSLDNK